jgi:hypothetical protein
LFRTEYLLKSLLRLTPYKTRRALSRWRDA